MENYTKLSVLLKVAGWFGDTRNLLTELKKHKNFKLVRKTQPKGRSRFSAKKGKYTAYVPRHSQFESDPVTSLHHESGHFFDNLKRHIKNDPEYSTGREILRNEQRANRHAIKHITDKKDVKAYVKAVKPDYESYKKWTAVNFKRTKINKQLRNPY